MQKSLNILLLEDNPNDAELVQRLLLKEMHSVVFHLASNEIEFLDQLDIVIPDVILADNSLDQFSASDALLILHGRSLRIPFILLTGTVSEEFASGIIKIGADDYILKDRLARLPLAIDAAIKKCKAENEKSEAYARLIQSEKRYRNVIEGMSDAFFALDLNWCCTYANAQIGLLTHRDPKTLIGRNIWEEFPEAVGSMTYNNYQKAIEDQTYITHTEYYEPLKLWLENHIYPSPEGLAVFIRDITVRKKAENDILQKNKELRDLSSYLQNVWEQERIRIAREIHDELGQQLTGLIMDMNWLKKQLTVKDKKIREKIFGSVQLINNTVKSVRRISSQLRPSMLDDLGLVPALEWHSREIGERTEITVEFKSSFQDLKIPIETTTGIFRIYQEALTNAICHTNANKIVSTLELSGEFLKMTIADNGKDMDLVISSSRKTLGLLSINERIHIMGGNFEFKSEPEKGTELLIMIPY